MNPNQKVIFVTGGSRGIGQAIVNRFKEEGWWVATCSTQISHLADSRADFTFQCDVSKVNDVKAGISQILEKFGRIDALVNNAGLAGTNPLNPESSDELWHQIIGVNLHGSYYMCKYIAPHLPDQSGRIINIASVLSLKGVPDQTAYCAAKHGVLGLTRALAHSLAPRKITVNAVCPGWVRTAMAHSRMEEIGFTEKTLETAVPLGRIIEPNEVADFVFYLTQSQGSAMITGQALTIDGGVLS